MSEFDVVIVGAGIAGASLAAEVAGAKSVLILEAEQQPGYHSTGRSAAFWSETYGGPAIQPLTSASQNFLAAPPAEFASHSLLKPRGALHVGRETDAEAAGALLEDFVRSGVALERLDTPAIATHVQGVLPGWSQGLWEPDCCDIDVSALHSGYLKAAKKAGAQLVCNAPLTRARFSGGRWHVHAGGQNYTSSVLVNTTGAWADVVAEMAGVRAIGITPYRRTIVQLAVEPAAPDDLPLVVGLDGSFYFKPEAGGKLWLSPHDEIASPACDAAPEEIDIALAIDRFQQVVDWKVLRLEHKWAGLRSFAPDRLPVIGRDPGNPAFFWLAGQGGFGIQTAPAVAHLAAALLLDRQVTYPTIDHQIYAPDRFF
jgi:D-arginine dehydrogenase